MRSPLIDRAVNLSSLLRCHRLDGWHENRGQHLNVPSVSAHLVFLGLKVRENNHVWCGVQFHSVLVLWREEAAIFNAFNHLIIYVVLL